MPLEKLTSYEIINGGAHRKAASIVGIPAIVRHIGLWDTSAPSETGETPRKNAYAAYVAALKEHIHESPQCAPHDKASWVDAEATDDSSSVNIIRFRWRGFFCSVRVEYHSEFVCVSSIIDCSVKFDQPEDEVAGFGKAVKLRFENLEHDFNRGSFDAKSHRSIRFFQYGVWKLFEQQVLNARVENAAGEREELLGARLGKVFVDLRGIVTGSRLTGLGKQANHRFRPAFTQPPKRKRSRKMEHGAPGEEWARRIVNRMWPLIETRDVEDHEFSVSCALDGRAVFITALGPKPGSTSKEASSKWQPVRYFVHAYTDDEWQLGRLVDRLNTMGTLRLAAAMDIDGLRLAAGQIELLADDIDNAGKSIVDEIRTAMPDQHAKKSGAVAVSVANGGEAAASLADTGGDGIAKTADEWMRSIQDSIGSINAMVANGDMSYRLDRSQYYIGRFHIEAQALRLLRVEGFQPYDEFVTRRMSPIFEHVKMLNRFMEAIYFDLSRLNSHYSSLKIALVTKEINSLVESMEVQNDEISKIQEFGEYALIGILIPYYLGSAIIEDFLEVKDERAKAVVWGVLLVFCAIFVIWRMGGSIGRARTDIGQKKVDTGKAKTALTFLQYLRALVIVYAVAILVVMVVHVTGMESGDTPPREQVETQTAAPKAEPSQTPSPVESAKAPRARHAPPPKAKEPAKR